MTVVLDWGINEIEFLEDVFHKIRFKAYSPHCPFNESPICFDEINSFHFFSLKILFIKYFLRLRHWRHLSFMSISLPHFSRHLTIGEKLTKIVPAMICLLPLKIVHSLSFWPLFYIWCWCIFNGIISVLALVSYSRTLIKLLATTTTTKPTFFGFSTSAVPKVKSLCVID